MMKVATNTLEPNVVHTTDEQGLCKRTIRELIFHAANRHACTNVGLHFFFDHHQKEVE